MRSIRVAASGVDAPSVLVPESFARLSKDQGSPSVDASSATLQMFLQLQSFCLRVSGAVAPSAPLVRTVSPALHIWNIKTLHDKENLNNRELYLISMN